MQKTSALMVGILVLLLSPIGGYAQSLDDVAKAMGATNLKSIEYTATGSSFSTGQSTAPGQPWPRFNVKNYTRSINYETASLREDAVRQRAQGPGGGAP